MTEIALWVFVYLAVGDIAVSRPLEAQVFAFESEELCNAKLNELHASCGGTAAFSRCQLVKPDQR